MIHLLALICLAAAGSPTSRPVAERKSNQVGASTPLFVGVTRARATRKPTASSRTVKQAELNTHPLDQTTQLLKTVPGLHISQHNGRGKAHQLFLRGFDAVHGGDLEIRLAGIPLNEVSNIHGQGYADLGLLIPETVRRLTYSKGPFTAQQGDFAVTGSIGLELGLPRRGISLTGGLGSNWRRRLVALWGPRGFGPSTFGALAFSEGNGFGQGRSWIEGAAAAQVVLSLGLAKLRLLAIGHATRFGTAGVLREDDLKAGRIGFYDARAPGLGGSSSRLAFQGEVTWGSSGDRGSLMSYVLMRGLRLKENFTGYLRYPAGDTVEQLHDVVQAGARAQLIRRLRVAGRNHLLRLGLELRGDLIDQGQHRLNDSGARHTTEVEAEIRALDLSGWASLLLRPVGRLELAASLRVDLIAVRVVDQATTDIRGPTREAAGLHLGPRLTATLPLGSSWTVFLAYGKGFRSPQSRSLADGEQTPFTVAHCAELGAVFARPGTIRAALALFGYYLDQELVFDHATARNSYAGPSWRTGAELELSAIPWRLLRLEGSITYTEGRLIESDRPIPSAPRVLARAGLTVGWWRTATGSPVRFLTLRASLLGPRPLTLGERAESVFLLDLVACFELGPATLRLELSNLLNTTWKDGQFVYSSSFQRDRSASELPVLHFTAGPPRRFMATLALRI